MRILVATDAFRPQVNGVVRSLESAGGDGTQGFGVTIDLPEPARLSDRFRCPPTAEIRLALTGLRGVADRIGALERAGPAIDHMSISRPKVLIGHAVRRFCRRQKRPAVHDELPHPFSRIYFGADADPRGVDLRATSVAFPQRRRRHHGGDAEPHAQEMGARGFKRLMQWSRGSGWLCAFQSIASANPGDLPRPIFLYAGRLAPEKEHREISRARPAGLRKWWSGDGPSAATPATGLSCGALSWACRKGEDLARVYASSDVFVFPSRTDTFGMVLLEAHGERATRGRLPGSGARSMSSATSGGGVRSTRDLHARRLPCRARHSARERARAHAETFTWDPRDGAVPRQYRGGTRRGMRREPAGTAGASGKEGQLVGQGHAVEP